MKVVKGINVGSADIISSYESSTTVEDVVALNVVARNLGDVGVISTPSDSVYSGSPQTPPVSVTANIEGESILLVENTDYTISYENNTNAGVATVKATGMGNYTGEVSTTFNINNANITVSSENQSYIYDKLPHGLGVTVSVIDGTPTISYRLTSSGAYNISTTPMFTNVSESGTVYFKVTAPNHNDYEGYYTLQITPKVVLLQWGQTSWTYDGTSHSTTCEVSNLESGDTCTVTLTGNPSTSITNIGTTTVTASSLSNSNYTLTGASDTSRVLTVLAGMFVKVSGVWTPVKRVYKKVSNVWVEQTFTEAFDTTKMYIKKN